VPRHRYAVLDTFRFFAALGVVLYHFEGHLSALRPHPSDSLDRFQSLVDFFFVLSGFVLMHTYGERIVDGADYLDFLRKRIARIYPLHLATILGCLLIGAIVWWLQIPVRERTMFDLHQLGQNLLLIQAWGTTSSQGFNGPAWSISAEFFVYLLFPLFVWILTKLQPWAVLCLAALFAVSAELLRHALGLPPLYLATYDFGMARAVPTFLAGMAVYRIVTALPARPVSWLWPGVMSLAIVALMLAKAPMPSIIVLYPVLVGLIAAAERGGTETWLGAPALVSLGNASFAIYMLHTFIEIPCVGIARRMNWTSVPQLISIAAVGTVLIVVFGMLSYRLFETPMRRWIGGTGKRSAPSKPYLSHYEYK
jgi:peptidoglycan/LPS O-acetylase OafA/YrhL